MPDWTAENRRHLAALLHLGSNPAARIYDSLGPDLWLAPAPGWLNLGLWEGPGEESEAPLAVRRLVETLASHLPVGGDVIDVGNGLGAQDLVIADVVRPRTLVAVNITESQLRAGAERLVRARAAPVVGDATRLPLQDRSADGVISVEAAFHFPSRAAFFSEVRRVVRPGGVLAMSDVAVERLPRGPREAIAGVTNLRFWGIRARAVASAERIAALAESAGLERVSVRRCGARVIAPAVRLMRGRLRDGGQAPRSQRLFARIMLGQWDLLHRNGVIDYLLVTASAPRNASDDG
jgi:erythromycin 3''-O-methyltransferase